jgi:hypothetical protein
MWRGKKFEDRYTQVALLLWENLESSHAFFTGPEYAELHEVIQPAMNGRSIAWTAHATLDHSPLSDHAHLAAMIDSLTRHRRCLDQSG